MTKRSKQRSAIVDGEKIKTLSREHGMNQKALANAAGVSPRTLQRAERGERVRLDLIGNIANALQVQSPEIMLDPGGSDAESGDQQSRSGYQLIRVKRIKTARELAEMIIDAGTIIFQTDVDVTNVSSREIAKVMEMIEGLRSNQVGFYVRVRLAQGREWLPVDPKSIRFLGDLQSAIDHLGTAGSVDDEPIGIFAGKYQQTYGYGEPRKNSSGAARLQEQRVNQEFVPPNWIFDTATRLAVRFSQQQVASFSYEAPIGLTGDEAEATIHELREEGHVVLDLREPFDAAVQTRLSYEEIESYKTSGPRITNTDARFGSKSDARIAARQAPPKENVGNDSR